MSLAWTASCSLGGAPDNLREHHCCLQTLGGATAPMAWMKELEPWHVRTNLVGDPKIPHPHSRSHLRQQSWTLFVGSVRHDAAEPVHGWRTHRHCFHPDPGHMRNLHPPTNFGIGSHHHCATGTAHSCRNPELKLESDQECPQFPPWPKFRLVCLRTRHHHQQKYDDQQVRLERTHRTRTCPDTISSRCGHTRKLC